MTNATDTTNDKMTIRQHVNTKYIKSTLTNHKPRIYGVIKQWNKTADDYAEMGGDVLELLAHPDTELSQATQAWEAYRDASKRINAMRDELGTRYPEYDFYI
jgi:hypothetical protein